MDVGMRQVLTKNGALVVIIIIFFTADCFQRSGCVYTHSIKPHPVHPIDTIRPIPLIDIIITIMHGSSNSATLIITAAGLAMVTAATFLVHAEKEKHQREQQQDHDSAANASSSVARRTILLERQSSTVSRSKRDRIIYAADHEEEDNEEEDNEEEDANNHKPPVISIGVPTSVVVATEQRSVGPDGVDVSFDTHASVEEVSSCDDESTLLLLAAADTYAVSDEVFKMTNREWKGMTSFLFLALLWGLGAVLLPILVGTQSIDDVRTNLLENMDAITAVLEHWSAVVWSLIPKEELGEETAAVIATTTTRHVQGAYGPFFG
jgi:hypothetical protein